MLGASLYLVSGLLEFLLEEERWKSKKRKKESKRRDRCGKKNESSRGMTHEGTLRDTGRPIWNLIYFSEFNIL